MTRKHLGNIRKGLKHLPLGDQQIAEILFNGLKDFVEAERIAIRKAGETPWTFDQAFDLEWSINWLERVAQGKES